MVTFEYFESYSIKLRLKFYTMAQYLIRFEMKNY